MARWIDAKCRLCRREGIKLFLKGAKCDGPKCPVSKRETTPGMHQSRKRPTAYGIHLREKQRAKRVYGLMERPFKRVFAEAARAKGNTGENFLRSLESRLDNILYRAGWATSHAHARQIVGHGHIRVNGRRVDIPSFVVAAGDSVTPVPRERSTKIVKAAMEESRGRQIPTWLTVDPAQLVVKPTVAPVLAEIQVPVRDQLIVELASR